MYVASDGLSTLHMCDVPYLAPAVCLKESRESTLNRQIRLPFSDTHCLAPCYSIGSEILLEHVSCFMSSEIKVLSLSISPSEGGLIYVNFVVDLSMTCILTVMGKPLLEQKCFQGKCPCLPTTTCPTSCGSSSVLTYTVILCNVVCINHRGM